MPMAMHPNKKFRLVLECDKDCDPQPCFFYPYLTGIQQETLIDTFDAINDAANQRDNFDRTYEAATRHLNGWEHITDADGNALDCNLESFKQVVGLMEAMEIINKLLMQQNLDLAGKKK